MRVKAFFLVAMVVAYGYYLRTVSVELTRRVEGIKAQYSAALAQVSAEAGQVSSSQDSLRYTASK